MERIQELNDLKIIEGKRTYRKGLITKVMKKIDAIERKPLRNARLSDVTRHLGEMEQAARLFEALQDRYEEVLSAIPDSDIEGEQAKGELTKQEHQDFIERVVDLKVRLNHYHEGLTLRDTIEAIFDSEILNVPAIISRISQVEKLTQSFRSNTIDYAEDETISPVRQAIHGDLKSLFMRLSAEQKLKTHLKNIPLFPHLELSSNLIPLDLKFHSQNLMALHWNGVASTTYSQQLSRRTIP